MWSWPGPMHFAWCDLDWWCVGGRCGAWRSRARPVINYRQTDLSDLTLLSEIGTTLPNWLVKSMSGLLPSINQPCDLSGRTTNYQVKLPTQVASCRSSIPWYRSHQRVTHPLLEMINWHILPCMHHEWGHNMLALDREMSLQIHPNRSGSTTEHHTLVCLIPLFLQRPLIKYQRDNPNLNP